MTTSVTEPPEDAHAEQAVAAAPGFARFSGQSATFALGSVAGKVTGLLLVAVLVRLLQPAEFGSMDVLMSLGSALTVPLLLGLDVATLRLYFDRPDRKERRTLIATSLLIVLGVTLVAGAIVVLGSAAISDALFGSTRLQPAVVAVAVSVVAVAIQAMVLTVLRAQSRAGVYAAFSGGFYAFYAILAVTLLVVWRADATAMLIAYAVSAVLAAAVGVLLVRDEAVGRPAWSAGRALLRLGLPLTPAVVAVYVADFANRTILLGAGGADEVGYLGVALRFSSVAALAGVGFRLAWQPRAFSLGWSSPARVRLAADARWIIAILCGSVTVVAVASPEIVELLSGGRYSAALSPLAFSLVAVVLASLAMVASLSSSVAKATQELAAASVANVGVAIALNLVLAPSLYATGTALAMAGGWLAELGALLVFGMRRPLLPFSWLRAGGLSTVVGIAVVGLLATNAPPLVRLSVGALTLGVIAAYVPLGPVLHQAKSRFMR